MRARPDKTVSGPAVGGQPARRSSPAVVVGIAVVVGCGLLVLGLAHLLDRSASSTQASPTGSIHPTPSTGSGPPAAMVDPSGAGPPPVGSQRAAAAFIDAWLTKEPAKRLPRLRTLTVPALYEGLTFTDPAEIPAAHRAGRPRVEDTGPYLVRYRVPLSDRSEVTVAAVYDGTHWLVESVEPAGN